MAAEPALVVFEGHSGSSLLERQFAAVRRAVVLDQLEQAAAAGISRRILCTPDSHLAVAAAAAGAEVECEAPSARAFHFGQRLWEVVQRKGLHSVLYLGGASAPLISAQDFRLFLSLLRGQEGVVVANNFHSADMAAFAPAEILGSLRLPPVDNALPFVLVHEGGFRNVPVPRLLSLNFDLDTPADLPILAVHPRTGPRAREALADLAIDLEPCRKIRRLLFDPMAELVLFGRVSGSLFRFLDEATHCRVRLYSEERGMKALGRDIRHEVRSLMGAFIDEIGCSGFFDFLSAAAQGAVLDTRVLFAHWQWELSQEDRFSSDAGLLHNIVHSGLQQFTAAAKAASIPVLLGGHSLVAGGLWALIDAGPDEEEAV